MIQEISFEQIKLYWKILWPDLDVESEIKYVSVPSCPFISSIFVNLAKHSPRSIPSIFIGYYIDSKIIGVLNGYKTSPHFFRTRGLWVADDYRRLGIATKLMRNVEEFAFECGCKELWTIPRKSAINFYKQYGFEQMTDFIIRDDNHCYATKLIQGD